MPVIIELDRQSIEHTDNMVKDDYFIGPWGLEDVAEGTNKDDDRHYDDDFSRIDVMEHDNSDAKSMHGQSPDKFTVKGVIGHYETSTALKTEGATSGIPCICCLPNLRSVTRSELSLSIGKTIENEQMFATIVKLKNKLSMFAIINNFEYRVKKSDKA